MNPVPNYDKPYSFQPNVPVVIWFEADLYNLVDIEDIVIEASRLLLRSILFLLIRVEGCASGWAYTFTLARVTSIHPLRTIMLQTTDPSQIRSIFMHR